MRHPERAMYDQIEDTLTSITMQLRSAIQADAGMTGRASREDALHAGSLWPRKVTADLGSVLLDTLGLAATIEWHLRQVQKCTGILYRLTVNNAAVVELPDHYAQTIFDIYTEALSNVARHAGATRVAVVLTFAPHRLLLAVADDGLGLANEAPASSTGGIAGMRARSQSHKGYCAVTSSRNAGTTVTVGLPIVHTA